MTKNLSLVALAALALLTTSIANAAEAVPGDTCTVEQENYFQRTGGNEIPTGHFIVCKSGTWRSILSWDAAAAITKIGNLSCTNGQILKFNGTTWGCASDSGGSLPALTSANIWVGNGSNAATAVAMSGDATLSNAGVLTISSNAVGSAEITNASIALADLSATGTASATTYLRGDNTWATVPSGADNLGDHIATTVLRSDTHNTDDLGTTAIRWKDGWFAGTVTGGTFAGSGASLTALNATNLASGTVPAARMPALTGDVTMTTGTTATTIANSVVSNTKLANMAANTIKGNNTGAAAAPADVTVAQLRTMLAPTGTPGTTTFLRGDGQWIAPPSGADNLGNHTATQGLAMGNYDVTGVRQVIGGFGAMATTGTLDWNDVSNARAGSGYSLLYGSATNGPGPATYFHPFSFEYGAKDGSGQLTQVAIPYGVGAHLDSGLFIRGRYSGTWSSWRKILTENSSGNITVSGSLAATTLSGSGASLTALPAANLTGTLPAISGANLTSLNASNLASGTVPDARLTGNYSGLGTVTATSFVGSGTSLTALNATNLASGTVPAARLPAYTGDVTKAAGGTALTIATGAVTTTEILDGTIANADIANATVVATTKLSATGTKDSTTFLRGDNTWATPPTGGGGISAAANVSCTAPTIGSACAATCPAGYFAASAVVVSGGDKYPCVGSTASSGTGDCWYSSASAASIQNPSWGGSTRTLHVRCLQ